MAGSKHVNWKFYYINGRTDGGTLAGDIMLAANFRTNVRCPSVSGLKAPSPGCRGRVLYPS